MAVKIAIMCHKGGVAKTSTVQTLASELNGRGSSVLIIDFDQQNNHKTLMGVSGRDTAGMAGVLMKGHEPERIVVEVRPGIDLITSGGKAITKYDSLEKTTPNAELMIKSNLSKLEDKYDYILMDTPPSMSLISAGIVIYADYVVIPCDMDTMGFAASKNVIDFLDTYEKQTTHKVAKVLGVLPVKCDLRRNLDNLIMDQLYAQDDSDLLRGGWILHPIRHSANIRTAQARKKFLQELFSTKPLADDYKKATDHILDFIKEDRSSLEGMPVQHQAQTIEANL